MFDWLQPMLAPWFSIVLLGFFHLHAADSDRDDDGGRR